MGACLSARKFDVHTLGGCETYRNSVQRVTSIEGTFLYPGSAELREQEGITPTESFGKWCLALQSERKNLRGLGF